MFQFSSLGMDEIARRELFALELSEFEALPRGLSLDGCHFACLVACDADAVPLQRLWTFCETLLRGGAVYLCSWGPGCERLHDLFDEVSRRVHRDPSGIVTTWHAHESLDDALWYLIHLTPPTPRYASTCVSSLAVSVGIPGWSSRIRKVLDDPSGLEERVGAALA